MSDLEEIAVIIGKTVGEYERRIRDLEAENKRLREAVEALARLDGYRAKHIRDLETENKKLRERRGGE